MSYKQKKLGIIGFGRFGRLVAGRLAGKLRILAHDPAPIAASSGYSLASFEECCRADYILLAVPISSFETVVEKLAGLVSAKALVLDVCSVKEHPMEVMAKHLTGTCSFLGTHPLFGPDTAGEGLAGRSIVLCPLEKNPRIEKAAAFLTGLGLKVIWATPEEHDRDMARSLALIHLLGRALRAVGADRVSISTQTHERLLELVEITANDSRELFLDMHRYNRFAGEARQKLMAELARMDLELGDPA